MFGVDGFGARAIISGPVPHPDHNGWMPAGTYMPLKDGAATRPLGGGDTFYYVRYRRVDSALSAEGGPGIAQSISHYERRFPSRVATWAPYADYDLLPDAD